MQRLGLEKCCKIYHAQILMTTSNSTTAALRRHVSEKAGNQGPPELLERKWQANFYQKEKGKIAGKLPFKLKVEKGKMYAWCTCGHSKKQPLCDFTHHIDMLRIKLRPISFRAPEDGYLWLCTCKQTNNRPFCDGSHKCQEVQETMNV
ncbi:Iron sulfur-containing domain CDGSH-type [Trinorchestia longiramus]|nr:Iron sulfur-containing domain CDGSH-type [Trinorchestia longiramus]